MILCKPGKCSLIIIIFFIILAGCNREEVIILPEKFMNADIDSALKITSIENRAVIPANLYQPLIEWEGANDSVSVCFVSKNHIFENKISDVLWYPSKKDFIPFLKDKVLLIFLFYQKNDLVFRSQEIKIYVSDDLLEQKIVMRLVHPFFIPEKTSYLKTLSLEDAQETNTVSIQNTCLGCHVFSGNEASLNMKRKADRRFVYLKKDSTSSVMDQKIIGHFSFFSSILNKRYMLVATNTYGEIHTQDNIIEPFDLMYKSGDIFVFDFLKESLLPLSGAAEIDYVEDMPSFSYDGNKVIYSRYQVTGDSISDMQLYVIDFNEGRGGKAKPLFKKEISASCYFARFSPDNKWVSFCMGNGKKGIFAKSSSDIYLFNLQNKKIRKMNLNQIDRMDSWHQWADNSRWMIISSKRDKNQLTALYLSYIDEKGIDYPLVKLYGNDSMKVNIPLFVDKNFNLPENIILQNFINEIYSDKNN